MKTRSFVIGVIATMLFAGPAAASEASKGSENPEKKEAKPLEPRQIVEKTRDAVIKILGDPAYDDPKKKPAMREKVRKLLVDSVDMKTVSMLTLANFRKKFSDKEFEQFSKVFERLLFATYITHLEKYTNEKMPVVGTKRSSQSREVVHTKTITDTNEIPVDFYFIQQGKFWKLYDVHIEGVSLIKNYRSQFREILLNSSAEQLIARLEKKVKENEERL